jgi:uncharacterized protein
MKRDESVSHSKCMSEQGTQGSVIMEMPLFPLDVVLFPGMALPLHIFEPRYREMIGRCIDEQRPFGVVLIDEGSEDNGSATLHKVGTAARITRVEHLDDGRMNITALGTQRFRILELDRSGAYLSATTCLYPVINGRTRLAEEMARKVRPQVVEYVELLSKASETNLRLDRLPENPKTLSMLVAIALQVSNAEKQGLLEIAGVPEILSRERYLLSWESTLLRHMVATQSDVEEMSIGWTGYVFPN